MQNMNNQKQQDSQPPKKLTDAEIKKLQDAKDKMMQPGKIVKK